MNSVGLLCLRNELDVLRESLTGHCDYFEQIVAQDGSTDGGTEVLRACPNIVKLFLDSEILKPGERFCDAHRNVALQWILKEFGADTWVTLLHADEFFHDSPIISAEHAERDRAHYVLWAEFRFFLHTEDRGQPYPGISYYCGPWFEIRQFSLRYHNAYEAGKDHCTLPGPGVERKAFRWWMVPRYRHYPYRSVEQVKKCYEDKCASRYWQPDHEWLKDRLDDPFVDCLPMPKNSPLAKWDMVRKYDGTLPNPMSYLPLER